MRIFIGIYFSQFTAQCQELQKQELKNFFSFAIESVVKKEVSQYSKLTVAEKTMNITKLNEECMKSFGSQVSFNQEEIDSLNTKANTASSLILTNENIIQSNFILSSAFNQPVTWKETICTLSDPLFFRNYNQCLFACNIAEGGGELIIFKKGNYKLKIYKKICAWYY